MSVLVRYACLLGLGLTSLFAVVKLGSASGQMTLAGSAPGAIPPPEMALWVLGLIALASLVSVIRFGVRLPRLVRNWFADHKEKLATLTMIGIVGVVFVVL